MMSIVPSMTLPRWSKTEHINAYYAPKVPLKFPRFPDEIERPYKSSGPIPRGEAEVLAFRRNLPIKQDAHSLIIRR
jgi:hypothetical protein